jgi:phosphoesterase RecJ-like protein
VNEELDQAKHLLTQAAQITILTHVRPDGDAVASLLALGLSLKEAGHQVGMILSDEIPTKFQFLPGSEQIAKSARSQPDLAIAVDTASVDRLSLPSDLMSLTIGINIDHHITNSRFGQVNLVDAGAAATTELLYHLLPKLDLPITKDVATNLLTGLLTDTIGLQTGSVRPEVLRMVAELQEMGVDYAQVYEKALQERTSVEAQYWGRGLSRLVHENGVVWTVLKDSDRREVGYSGYDDADLINFLRNIKHSEIAVIFIEQPMGKVKVSWRSRSGWDVSQLAESFGGGGHAPAAGAMIEGELEDVSSKVLEATYALISQTSEPAS